MIKDFINGIFPAWAKTYLNWFGLILCCGFPIILGLVLGTSFRDGGLFFHLAGFASVYGTIFKYTCLGSFVFAIMDSLRQAVKKHRRSTHPVLTNMETLWNNLSEYKFVSSTAFVTWDKYESQYNTVTGEIGMLITYTLKSGDWSQQYTHLLDDWDDPAKHTILKYRVRSAIIDQIQEDNPYHDMPDIVTKMAAKGVKLDDKDKEVLKKIRSIAHQREVQTITEHTLVLKLKNKYPQLEAEDLI